LSDDESKKKSVKRWFNPSKWMVQKKKKITGPLESELHRLMLNFSTHIENTRGVGNDYAYAMA
jgi:hypothetical protein